MRELLAADVVYWSSISMVEIQMKEMLGKLKVPESFVEEVAASGVDPPDTAPHRTAPHRTAPLCERESAGPRPPPCPPRRLVRRRARQRQAVNTRRRSDQSLRFGLSLGEHEQRGAAVDEAIRP